MMNCQTGLRARDRATNERATPDRRRVTPASRRHDISDWGRGHRADGRMAAGSETNGVVPRAPVEPVLPESPARVSSTGARAGAGEADHRARGQVSDAGEAMATPASEREQLGG